MDEEVGINYRKGINDDECNWREKEIWRKNVKRYRRKENKDYGEGDKNKR